MSWVASSFASSWPTALRTGAAAFLATASLTGSPPSAEPPDAQTSTFWQLSVPGVYRLNVHVPGACLFTWSTGPEPSPAAPTCQASPSAVGLPSTPSAFASRATSAAVTSPLTEYTGAEPGPSARSAPAR